MSVSAERDLSGVTVTLVLACLILSGGYLRFVGADWDAGLHVHPDERYVTMVTSALETPDGIGDYLDGYRSSLNPRNGTHDYVTYGTWPLVVTHAFAALLERTEYSQVYLVGRKVSAILDLFSVLLVFGIGLRLYGRRVALLAAALSTFTALQIQHAHFFTVDSAATCFALLCLFGLAGTVCDKPGGWVDIATAATGLGLALASKMSVWPLVPTACVVLTVVAYRKENDLKNRLLRATKSIAMLGVLSFLCLRLAQPDLFAGNSWPEVKGDPERYEEVTAGKWKAPESWFLAERLMPDALEPYLLPDPRWADNMRRIRRTIVGFGIDWPPNHQWWGRVAYFFPWSNMVLWGMGLPLGIAATVAWWASARALLRGDRRHLLLFLWITLAWLIFGAQWNKTLRYFLPTYPAFALLAAWWLVSLRRGTSKRLQPVARTIGAVVLVGTILWGVMFARIYMREHSQIAASRFIFHNLPTAFSLHVVDPDSLPGPWLPAMPSPRLEFEGFRYRIGHQEWSGPLRILAPDPAVRTNAAFHVDAVRLAYATVASEGEAPVYVEAVLSPSTELDDDGYPEGAFAFGRRHVEGTTAERAIQIPLDGPATVVTSTDHFLWVRVVDGAIRGRPAMLAHETGWDLRLPHALEGFPAADNPSTSHAEGLFGFTRFRMFAEGPPDWLDETLDGLHDTDFWITPTNRVYDAVRRLPMRFPQSIGLYDDVLFAERLGFRLFHEVHSFPGIGVIEIPDQSAEEAFHVYDHPQIHIFEKTPDYDRAILEAHLEPLADRRRWRYPAVSDRLATRLLDQLLGRIPVDREP